MALKKTTITVPYTHKVLLCTKAEAFASTLVGTGEFVLKQGYKTLVLEYCAGEGPTHVEQAFTKVPLEAMTAMPSVVPNGTKAYNQTLWETLKGMVWQTVMALTTPGVGPDGIDLNPLTVVLLNRAFNLGYHFNQKLPQGAVMYAGQLAGKALDELNEDVFKRVVWKKKDALLLFEVLGAEGSVYLQLSPAVRGQLFTLLAIGIGLGKFNPFDSLNWAVQVLTGSRPAPLPQTEFDELVLNLIKAPEKLWDFLNTHTFPQDQGNPAFNTAFATDFNVPAKSSMQYMHKPPIQNSVVQGLNAIGMPAEMYSQAVKDAISMELVTKTGQLKASINKKFTPPPDATYHFIGQDEAECVSLSAAVELEKDPVTGEVHMKGTLSTPATPDKAPNKQYILTFQNFAQFLAQIKITPLVTGKDPYMAFNAKSKGTPPYRVLAGSTLSDQFKIVAAGRYNGQTLDLRVYTGNSLDQKSLSDQKWLGGLGFSTSGEQGNEYLVVHLSAKPEHAELAVVAVLHRLEKYVSSGCELERYMAIEDFLGANNEQ